MGVEVVGEILESWLNVYCWPFVTIRDGFNCLRYQHLWWSCHYLCPIVDILLSDSPLIVFETTSKPQHSPVTVQSPAPF